MPKKPWANGGMRVSDQDAQKAMMDELMGRDRNLPEEEKRESEFWDADICKYYLCGISPHQLFRNTKSDLGPYDKIESPECKAKWDALTQQEKDSYGYEHETLIFLEDLAQVRPADREEQGARRG